MKIFITGAAGFIGFSLSQELLKKNHTIYAIDNLDEYYSVKLKKKRITILKKFKNFKFKKIDISQKKNLQKYLKKKKFDMIFHFAAQAGVRYSIIRPDKYIKSNLKGFKNLLFCLKNKKFSKIFYASSSSVYGDTKVFPIKENYKLNPKNLYAKTKIKNEKDARNFESIYKKKIIGLRFFTVYGEWGRPDMLILKMLSCMKKNRVFYLNNSGDHYRDFTYIKDVIKILVKLVHNKHFDYNIYNICSSKPIFVKSVVRKFKKITNYNLIENINRNKLDVYKTYGDNNRVKKLIKVNKFTNFDKALVRTIKWYKKIGYKFF